VTILLAAKNMPVQMLPLSGKEDISVLATKYGFILNFDEIFVCAGKYKMEAMAVIFAKLLTD